MRNLQYINLPKVPDVVVERYLAQLDSVEAKYTNGGYTWSDSNNKLLNKWCQQNICADMYWGVQLMSSDLPIHIDDGTTIKFVYLLQTGGENVRTHFHTGDQITETYIIPNQTWHILRVNTEHSVEGIAKDSKRISITGKIF
jgi:hypothetical protein